MILMSKYKGQHGWKKGKKNSGKALPPPFFRAMPERNRFLQLRSSLSINLPLPNGSPHIQPYVMQGMENIYSTVPKSCMATAIHSRKADTLKQKVHIKQYGESSHGKHLETTKIILIQDSSQSSIMPIHLEKTFGKGDSQSTREKEVAPTKTNLVFTTVMMNEVMTIIMIRLMMIINDHHDNDDVMT